MRFRRRGFLVVFGAIILATTGCAFAGPAAEGSFERSLTVNGPVDLDVSTGAGRIEVRAGHSTIVRVLGRIRARDDFRGSAEEKVRFLAANPPIEQTGNSIRIGRVEEERYRNNVSISYEIEVPEDTRLRGSTGSGSQLVTGIRGPLTLKTGSGGIEARGIGAEVEASTGSGSIDLDSVKGQVKAHTGSGSVRAMNVAGGLSAHTGSGRISFDQTAPGDVEVSTGSGSIEANGVHGSIRARTGSGNITVGGEPRGEWNLEAASGTVRVRLDSNASFELAARSSSGRITVNHPLMVTGTVSRKEIRGRIRGGGPLIEARTSSGDIIVE